MSFKHLLKYLFFFIFFLVLSAKRGYNESLACQFSKNNDTATYSGNTQFFRKEFLSPFIQTQRNISDSILIEPTSPVLGKNLSSFIKNSKSSPEQIIHDVEFYYAHLYIELNISCKSYLTTLLEGIEKHYQEKRNGLFTARESNYKVSEPYAIPYVVLSGLNDSYRHNLLTNFNQCENQTIEELTLSTSLLSNQFREKRKKDPAIQQLYLLEKKVKKYLPNRFDRLVDLNSTLSSPEASYPRLQFSVNGFTQYVFDELLKLEYLDSLVLTGYNLHEEWIATARKNNISMPLISFVIEGLKKSGYSYNDAFLYLCYTSRNMPSLDLQYGYSAQKAFMLEVYFWQTKNIYVEAKSKYFNNIYPNKHFENSPALYHFMTASYLAYKIHSSGYLPITALSLTILNKLGYKTHKLIYGTNPKLRFTKKIIDMYNLAKNQDFKCGFESGYWGGKYGLELAKKENKITKKNSFKSPYVKSFSDNASKP